jgi:hypothetical protein
MSSEPGADAVDGGVSRQRVGSGERGEGVRRAVAQREVLEARVSNLGVQ